MLIPALQTLNKHSRMSEIDLTKIGIPADYGKDPYLPKYAEPDDLMDIGPNIMGRPQQLSGITVPAWRHMVEAAADDDVQLLIVSGFRSIADQVRLIIKKLNDGQHIDDILRVNTAPGYSQHHSGRAIDIATPGIRPLTTEFAESSAFQWLTRNSASFGFSMPYDLGNIYDIDFEPWHWFFDGIQRHERD